MSIEQAMSHGMTQEPTLQWMWADTLFPALARRNPLRWSIPATFAEAASEMECEGERTRGVVLRIIPPGLDGGDHGRESAGIEYWLPGLRSGGSFKREHQFESLPAALAWFGGRQRTSRGGDLHTPLQSRQAPGSSLLRKIGGCRCARVLGTISCARLVSRARRMYPGYGAWRRVCETGCTT